MSVRVDLSISADDDNELFVYLEPHFIRQLNAEINAIDRRFGPDRSIGPVRVDVVNSTVNIGTQKQGDQEYVIDEFGMLKPA